ncbi:hypothetical protein K469DRAFT_746439 [Zopfia rhizophila CBS 207.26]|uniref:Large ribosomal subunit protein mL50 n=1 Tax=Zopfia rhizophila CBS 207.26 TaxID=1314779 RepID=A0A6A6EFZ5_9PEZI|nr:hypothetical protein K469DRAFT_746439 [Zopfia rhizophila CBS 207.26]
MRRIPRPQRPINNVASSSLRLQPRISPSPYWTSLPRTSHLPATCAACFSNSPHRLGFLDGKQDKRKHQAFVRRWQKRLLGESEPVGAHVDPYDPTSPVRISPEEQGEEQEELEKYQYEEGDHKEADTWDGLERVGGEKWIQQYNEWKMGEKALWRPEFSYAPAEKITNSQELRAAFHRALVEVFTLRHAGKDMGLAAASNRESGPEQIWISDIKLRASPDRGIELVYPHPLAMQDLLEWLIPDPNRPAELEGAIEFIEEIAPEQLEEMTEYSPGEKDYREGKDRMATRTIDDISAQTKQSGLPVKQDKKPFDFMSNRPVPRSKPDEPTQQVDEVAQKMESTVVEEELESPSESAKLESSAQATESAIAVARQAIREEVTARAGTSYIVREPDTDEPKYRHIPLTDLDIKFALIKRLTQLTGLRISDPHINDIRTLGDLYGHLNQAAKPKPKKLMQIIQEESKRNKRKKGMEELMRLPNVRLSDRRVTPVDRDREVGRWKVMEYALRERGLPVTEKE